MHKFLKLCFLAVSIGIFLVVIDKIVFENTPGLLYTAMGFVIALDLYRE